MVVVMMVIESNEEVGEQTTNRSIPIAYLTDMEQLTSS